MWRLEHWLEHSSVTLSQLLRAGVPTSIEHLEEVIQDHREFLLQVMECNHELMHGSYRKQGGRLPKKISLFN